MKLVSILIGINRFDEYTDDAINSILSQTHKNLEVVIVANGSECDALKSKLTERYHDSRIKLFSTPIPQLSFALNFGLSHCTGEYVARMDTDDISEPSRIEKQLEYITTYDLDVLGTSARLIDSSGKEVGISTPPSRKQIDRHLPFKNTFIHPSIIFRKKKIMDVRGYCSGLNSEDYDLWLRLRRTHVKWDNTKEILINYRVHSNSSQRKINAYAECAGYAAREFILTKSAVYLVAMFYWLLKALKRGV